MKTKMNIALVAHTENFKDNKKHFSWLVSEIEKIEKRLKIKIKINWMLEEDETEPFSFEIRGNNRGDLIKSGGKFFKDVQKKRKDELGIHIHFVKNKKFDVSESAQRYLIKSAKNKFEKAFGISPKSFVGGWWHSDEKTLKILKEEGFLVDASPMPLYKEVRKSWIGGRILNPFRKVVVCDWSNFTSRKPFFSQNLLIVPNAVNPKIGSIDQKLINFPIVNTLYLDDLNKSLSEQIVIFQNFKDNRISTVTIPFHPSSINEEKIVAFEKFIKEISKRGEVKFITLNELYRLEKKK